GLVTATAMLLSACASGDAGTDGKARVVNASLEATEAAPLIPAGPGQIVVRISGEGFEGGPEFKIFMDGAEIGGGTVDWALDTATEGFARTYDGSRVINFSSGSRTRLVDNLRWKNVSFDVDMPAGGPNVISVFFANDKYKKIEHRMFDRNLIVDWVEVNGHRMQAEQTGVILEAVGGATEKGMEKMLRNGALVFDVQNLLGIAPEEDTDTVASK
ncbi:MAG: carbohydrate-binding domain-containing protein, partial [Alphaproteobacteria bacterium]